MKYTKEIKENVLNEFSKITSGNITMYSIKTNGLEDLFYKITGNRLSASSIYTAILRWKEPEKYKEYAYKTWLKRKEQGYKYTPKIKKSISDNPLFSLSGEAKFILVPSHGDIHCFDTTEEIKEAVEKSQSSNISLIKFKLFKTIPINIKSTVSCHIG